MASSLPPSAAEMLFNLGNRDCAVHSFSPSSRSLFGQIRMFVHREKKGENEKRFLPPSIALVICLRLNGLWVGQVNKVSKMEFSFILEWRAAMTSGQSVAALKKPRGPDSLNFASMTFLIWMSHIKFKLMAGRRVGRKIRAQPFSSRHKFEFGVGHPNQEN